MTIEAETPSAPEAYPWDQPEDWYHKVQASLVVIPATPVRAFDYPHPEMEPRVVGLVVGDFTLHLGSLDGDSEIVAVIDRLIEPLQELRFAAKRRIADGQVPA